MESIYIGTGEIVVRKNVVFHETLEVLEVFEEYGIECVFLPPYSPSLNPTERFV